MIIIIIIIFNYIFKCKMTSQVFIIISIFVTIYKIGVKQCNNIGKLFTLVFLSLFSIINM